MSLVSLAKCHFFYIYVYVNVYVYNMYIYVFLFIYVINRKVLGTHGTMIVIYCLLIDCVSLVCFFA